MAITDLDNFFDTDKNGVVDFFTTKLDTIVEDFSDVAYTEYTVTSKNYNTPDLISWLYYRTMNYWWFILLVNGIWNSFEIPIGTNLKMYDESIIDKYLTNVVNKTKNKSTNSTITYGSLN